MTPQLNVNLKQCDSACHTTRPGSKHYDHCSASPVLIPCPIPRSVTFSVVLGECPSWCRIKENRNGKHTVGCPARPVRVSCSISGATWEDSDLGDWETDDVEGLVPLSLYHACRARWALVKALVLGKSKVCEFQEPFRMVPAVSEILVQRDAIFAALANMARAENSVADALGDFETTLRGEPTGIGNMRRFSPEALERYVARLIEQVGALEVT